MERIFYFSFLGHPFLWQYTDVLPLSSL